MKQSLRKQVSHVDVLLNSFATIKTRYIAWTNKIFNNANDLDSITRKMCANTMKYFARIKCYSC